jgi:alkylation response protein AidB-like acyl-CoA dehydrogenase
VAFAVNALGSFPIILGGTEEQKQKYLPPVAKGEKPDRLRSVGEGRGLRRRQPATTAIKDGDDYVLNGEKKWNTNGGVAEFFTSTR